MRRDSRVLLMAVVESADAIADAVKGVSFDDYCNSRLIRAAVEREFITIGEALNNLSRVDRDLFARIDQAARIISLRNKLTHDYDRVDADSGPGTRSCGDTPGLLVQAEQGSLTWLKHGEGRQNPISEGSTHWRRRLKDGKNLHGD